VRAAEVPGVAGALIAVAEEELTHFRRVLEELERRGIPLGTPAPDAYAADLRKLVRAHGYPTGHPRPPERVEALVDRLLVAALIEARSCERFRLLADALAERGPANLCALYRELLASEARHYRTFVDLARRVAGEDADWVDGRFRDLVALEAGLSAGLRSLPSIHG
jgi:tRNA-(ms[2]io[6]A)-hydroxylase